MTTRSCFGWISWATLLTACSGTTEPSSAFQDTAPDDATVSAEVAAESDATPGPGLDVAEPAPDTVPNGDDVLVPDDGVEPPKDAVSTDIADSEGPIQPEDAVDIAEGDTPDPPDIGNPDVVLQGGALGSPQWTVQGGCATKKEWASAACIPTPCQADETCVGEGVCVPGTSFLVDPLGSPLQSYPAVAMQDDSGAFGVAWSEGGFFDGTQHILFRVFPGGTAEGAAVLTVTEESAVESGRAPSVATLSDGSWLVLWRAENLAANTLVYRAQRILADGSGAVGDPFDASTTSLSIGDGGTNVIAPLVVRLRNDQIIMAWSGAAADGSTGYGVFARLFDAAGVPVTDELKVSDFVVGTSSSSAAIARLPAGLALVTWQSGVPGTKNDQVVHGRIVKANGELGPELILSPGVQAYEALPAVAAYLDGRTLLTTKISDISGSTSAVQIRGQLFPPGIEDAVPGLTGGPIQDVDYDGDGSYPGSAPVAVLSEERAVAVWHNYGDPARTIWLKRHYREHDVWDCEREEAGGPLLTDEVGTRFLPAVAASEAGTFVIVYSTLMAGFDEVRVAARVFSY